MDFGPEIRISQLITLSWCGGDSKYVLPPFFARLTLSRPS